MSPEESDQSTATPLSDVDHLVTGGIYSVLANQHNRGDFVLAKVVGLTPTLVHVVIYPPSFKVRPTKAEVSQVILTLAVGVNEARERHVAMSRKLFSLIRPVYAREEALSDDDLAGYRRWSLLAEKETIEAPLYIAADDNPDVYQKIFCFCGLPFGVLQGAYHYFREGLVPGVCAFVFGFVIFGGGMVVAQYLAVKWRARQYAHQSLAITPSASPYQITEIVLPRSFGDTFSLCQEAIRTVKHCRVTEEDFGGGTVEGLVNFSLTSEGELIILTTYMIAAGETGVVVASMPRSGGMVDLGKNFDNVARIVSYLQTACK